MERIFFPKFITPTTCFTRVIILKNKLYIVGQNVDLYIFVSFQCWILSSSACVSLQISFSFRGGRVLLKIYKYLKTENRFRATQQDISSFK